MNLLSFRSSVYVQSLAVLAHRHRQTIIMFGLMAITVLASSSIVEAQALSSTPNIGSPIESSGWLIYRSIRGPVSFTALVVAVGLAKFHPKGYRLAAEVVGGVILWASVPSIYNALRAIFG